MAYRAEKPPLPESIDDLRARIPGWGADLDPRDRPSVPQERFDPAASGAHWHVPERQQERSSRERSIEHAHLTPVFGTAAPLKGLSGVIRRRAYTRYSEARAAHWLLLVAADRVDVVESRVGALARLRPDDPVTETGVLAELRAHGLSSRFGRGRTDVRHQLLDPVVAVGPTLLAAGLAVRGVRRLVRSRRS